MPRPGPKRKVVLLVYDWSIRLMGGSIRAITFARALPALGWEVLVITASPPEEWPEMPRGVQVIYIPSPERGFGGGISAETDESRLDANPGWLRWLGSIKRWFPLERQLSWYPAFFRHAVTRCREAGVSAVLTVVAPNVMMPLGHMLAWRLGVPHFVDLRDDFADRHRVENITAMYQRLLNAYGSYVTRRARAISVVSPLTRDRFNAQGIRARLIMNGYVEDHFESVPWSAEAKPGHDPLRLIHLGWLGNFRSIAPLVAAIAQLTEGEQARLRVEHYGLLDPGQVELLQACACKSEIHPQVSHAEAIRIMSAADVLLAIPGDRIPAAMSGKLFEYLRARRPILLIAGEGAARELGERAGVRELVSPVDIAGITISLRRLLADHTQGVLGPNSQRDFVVSLERSAGSKLLANMLSQVSA